jgi:Di-haem oxidoreductase, putative peroxidase
MPGLLRPTCAPKQSNRLLRGVSGRYRADGDLQSRRRVGGWLPAIVRGVVWSTAISLIGAVHIVEARADSPLACSDLPDEPVLPGHVEQDEIVGGQLAFRDVFEAGRILFNASFNICDGQGRPATTGTGAARAPVQPAFSRISAPDASSCADCHSDPRPGGSGGVVDNVFVLAQALDPVTFSIAPEFSNERNTLGMFGAGPIEMLAREMTADLQAQALALKRQNAPDGDHVLTSKGVDFGITLKDGEVVAADGVDKDLVIKPFHQAGVVRSLREFTVNAMNHHHGMQAEERFDIPLGDGDFDQDGVTRELTDGDITAATIYQAALATPGRVRPKDPEERATVAHGEALFEQVGCTDCHIPKMRLDSRLFVEPYGLNPPGTFNDVTQSFAFDMTRKGEGQRLERTAGGGAVVRAYTDLKRHNLCDAPDDPDPIRFFCNEQLAQGRPDQDGRPGTEFFLTRKLWDVGNSAPYGHRGDLTTIAEAILAHGGEARATRDAFDDLPLDDQAAIVKFLKTLQVLPDSRLAG